MAGPAIYPGGLGGTGPAVATYSSDYFSATSSVVWVNTSSSTASDANAGTDRYKPKATLASALSAVAAQGVIVIEAG